LEKSLESEESKTGSVLIVRRYVGRVLAAIIRNFTDKVAGSCIRRDFWFNIEKAISGLQAEDVPTQRIPLLHIDISIGVFYRTFFQIVTGFVTIDGVWICNRIY
jgi:hypothetical protein